jgi:hypothetical protein
MRRTRVFAGDLDADFAVYYGQQAITLKKRGSQGEVRALWRFLSKERIPT